MRANKRARRGEAGPDHLLQAATACGAVINGLEIITSPPNVGGGHSVRASRALVAGEVIAQLPGKLLLSTERALASKLGRTIAAKCRIVSDDEMAQWMAGAQGASALDDVLKHDVPILTPRSVLCAFLIDVRNRAVSTPLEGTQEDPEEAFLEAYVKSLPGSLLEESHSASRRESPRKSFSKIF